MDTPAAPDWTRRCTVDDLRDLQEQPYMLRISDDLDSPWRLVKGTNLGFLTDEKTGARFDYLTVEFYDDDGERILNLDEEIEVGLVRPPTWPDDMEPPDWPRRQPT